MKKSHELSIDSLTKLGERIRESRIAAGLTQDELAGGEITRNMLSRIETGAALPSLPTLCIIAEKLEMPVGALLGDLSDYASYRMTVELRGMLNKKQYSKLLERYSRSTVRANDELMYILTEASVGQAEECFISGNIAEARAHIANAKRYAESTTFDTLSVIERAELCLMMTEEPDKQNGELGQQSRLKSMIFEKNRLAIYLWARSMLVCESADTYSAPNKSAKELNARLKPIISELSDGFLRSHIEAKLDIANADYLEAKARLVPYLDSADKLPPTLLFDLYTDLELCCKCCGDFENAYKYSNAKLALLQKIKL
ncbi:MAG: helix-turn-helix transcriptional regulator [Clostridiales bacterium]|nr:helix-turn-helix transcriptional regulator [Clostridiales bacterium]